MRRGILVCNNKQRMEYLNLRKIICELFEEKGILLEEMCFVDDENSSKYIEKLSADDLNYICSIDMAGFEMYTLLETCSYNIFFPYQLHIVIDKEKMELYKEKDMALNLYFFVPGVDAQLQEEYEHIPNMRGYVAFGKDEKKTILYDERNKSCVRAMVEYFLGDTE